MHLLGWYRLSDRRPPEGQPVETLIHDERGTRNEQVMQLWQGLWWNERRSDYVYYQPTHWRYRT